MGYPIRPVRYLPQPIRDSIVETMKESGNTDIEISYRVLHRYAKDAGFTADSWDVYIMLNDLHGLKQTAEFLAFFSIHPFTDRYITDGWPAWRYNHLRRPAPQAPLVGQTQSLADEVGQAVSAADY